MKESATEIFLRAIDKNKPARLIDKKIIVEKNILKIGGESYSLKDHPVYITATGKAAEDMCVALQDKIGVKEERVICIARNSEKNKHEHKQNYFYASHPHPDEKSEHAAAALIDFVERIPEEAVVLFALSGGTSALVSKPAEGISIAEAAEVNKLLLQSGAAIDEINCVRKHLSDIKGGQFLSYFQSGITLIDLVISDVPGDDLESIGSGLTIPDSTTFQDAYHILLEFDLWEKVSKSARNHIEKGLTGETCDTLKPWEEPIENHSSVIIGSAKQFAKSMAKIAEGMGFESYIAEDYYNSSVEKVIEKVIKTIKQTEVNSPQAFIFYGESTVNITGEGKGGRNQEMAMRAAAEIADMEDIVWLSAGTDGIDGPTDAAGAIVDNNTLKHAKDTGLEVERFIKNNDSYHFHKKMYTHLKTGPTGNNLMDVVLVLNNEH